MTSAEPVSIIVPSQTTPQTANDTKKAIGALMEQLAGDTTVHLSCSDGPPTVLALQLCHAAQVAVTAKGATVTIDDALTAQLNPPLDVQAGVTA